MMTKQKAIDYDTFYEGYYIGNYIQKEIDNGWLVKAMSSTPLYTYDAEGIKQHSVITVVYEKEVKEDE